MTLFVIDASVAIKWVVQEPGTPEALALRNATLAAPDLLIPECANILWKKHRLGQLTAGEASAAAQLLERADVELTSMRAHLRAATALAIELDHPAYDCLYIALALEKGCAFAAADHRLLRKVHQSARRDLATTLVDLRQAAASI
ncbi:MAG: type II toxin-antitoxin system VapC family toxin [Terricaulis sp.]